MCAHIGSRLDHIFDEMCQMNTTIGCIARRQSRLGGFNPFSSFELVVESFDSGDDESNDASGSVHDDEMIGFAYNLI